jgi:hypothetical protein
MLAWLSGCGGGRSESEVPVVGVDGVGHFQRNTKVSVYLASSLRVRTCPVRVCGSLPIQKTTASEATSNFFGGTDN